MKDVAAVKAIIDGRETGFEHYAVSTRLNAAKVDDERLLEPVHA